MEDAHKAARLAGVDRYFDLARENLTGAVAQLGLSEGKALAQLAHNLVTDVQRLVREQSAAPVTKHVPARPAPRVPDDDLTFEAPDPNGDWWCGQCGAVVAGKLGPCPKCGPVCNERQNIEMPF